MSVASAVAPPHPPPCPPPQKANSCTVATVKNSGVIKLVNNECSWAVKHPDVQMACFLGRVCEHAEPKKCQYYDIPSILQKGPTCGLTALSMMLEGNPTASELFIDATVHDYTINGEMFSAQYLFEVAQKHLNGKSSCQFYKGVLNTAEVKGYLTAGGCLLVPYDADVNHKPSQKNGHRAHWALILGYLLDDQDEFYVLARHGKTRNLAVWSLAALSASNGNLMEFAQPKGYEDCTFLLPPGGIGGALGLRERCILVNGLSHQMVHVR